MKYPKTDNQLRAEIIRNGGHDDIMDLEEVVSRDKLTQRGNYRSRLEALAEMRDMPTSEGLPSTDRTKVLPYGPT